jgi:menaquinone-dependent protoporphyrinogen IX oxidase
MKCIVLYDSKYGSTESIANWIAEGIGEKCATDVKKVTDVKKLDHDLIVIGSPVYGGKPLNSVVDFLKENRSALIGKKEAVFAVFSGLWKEKIPDYLALLKQLVPENIWDARGFVGNINVSKLDKTDRDIIEGVFTKIGKRFDMLDQLNKDAAVDFGRGLIVPS